MIFEHLVVGELGVNCYILAAEVSKGALIIDPGADFDGIKERLNKLKLTAESIILTHGHYDHIGAVNDFKAPVYAHKDEEKMLSNSSLNFSALFSSPASVTGRVKGLQDGDEVSLVGLRLRIIHTPGHSPGGICIRLLSPVSDMLFSGDTLFRGSVGRSDFPGANGKALFSAIKEKLFILPDDTVVYPGHGPKTTIGWEKKHNPFVR